MGVRGTDFSVETTGNVDTLNVIEGQVTVAQTTSPTFNTNTLDNILNTKGVPFLRELRRNTNVIIKSNYKATYSLKMNLIR